MSTSLIILCIFLVLGCASIIHYFVFAENQLNLFKKKKENLQFLYVPNSLKDEIIPVVTMCREIYPHVSTANRSVNFQIQKETFLIFWDKRTEGGKMLEKFIKDNDFITKCELENANLEIKNYEKITD